MVLFWRNSSMEQVRTNVAAMLYSCVDFIEILSLLYWRCATDKIMLCPVCKTFQLFVDD